MADELAKMGSGKSFIGPEPRVALSNAPIDGMLFPPETVERVRYLQMHPSFHSRPAHKQS